MRLTRRFDCCSLRSCPVGDNPGIYGQNREVQLLRCQATSGTFRFQFRQETTPELSWDIEAWELKAALEALDTVKRVDVDYSRERITSSTNSSYHPLNTCIKTVTNPYCIAAIPGATATTAAAVSGMTLATCKAGETMRVVRNGPRDCLIVTCLTHCFAPRAPRSARHSLRRGQHLQLLFFHSEHWCVHVLHP